MSLSRIVKSRKKRLGRGAGSGKGRHTVGRGQKGQKARGHVHLLFEGTKVKKTKLRQLPLRRGKAKFKAKAKPIVVNLEELNLMPSGSNVNLSSLAENGIIKLADGEEYGVKILGRGDLKTKNLKISLPTSKSAAKKIEKAGGKIV